MTAGERQIIQTALRLAGDALCAVDPETARRPHAVGAWIADHRHGALTALLRAQTVLRTVAQDAAPLPPLVIACPRPADHGPRLRTYNRTRPGGEFTARIVGALVEARGGQPVPAATASVA